jgi:hypothetical protein
MPRVHFLRQMECYFVGLWHTREEFMKELAEILARNTEIIIEWTSVDYMSQ